MAKKRTPQSLTPGSIVEISNPTDEKLRGCMGEVITIEPLTIAVVLPITAEQVTKLFDATDWNQVRKEATSLGIKIKGTKADLVGKIIECRSRRTRAEVAVAGRSVREEVARPASSAAALAQPRAAAASRSTNEINADDCVFIIGGLPVKPGQTLKKPGRICRVDPDNPAKFIVSFLTGNGPRRKSFTSNQLSKLPSCPTDWEVEPCS